MTPPVHVHSHTNQREPRVMDYYRKDLYTALGHGATWVWAAFALIVAVASAVGAVFILTGNAAAAGVNIEPDGFSVVPAVAFAVFGLITGWFEAALEPLRCGWCVARPYRSGALYHFATPDTMGQRAAVAVAVLLAAAFVLYLNGWVNVGVGFALQAFGFAVWFTVIVGQLAHRNRRHCARCHDME